MPNQDSKLSRRKLLRNGGLALGAVALGGSWQQWKEKDQLSVERRTLELPRWNADGFRVAFIADLHLKAADKLELAYRALDICRDEKPDLVAFGGDYLSANTPESALLTHKFFRRSSEMVCPVVAIFGNHDYRVGNPETIMDSVRKSRVRMLRNQVIEVGGVNIYGLDDGLHGFDKHDELTASQDKNVLVLFHEPDFVTRIDKRASLMLAGHSHGGQVVLPFIGNRRLPYGARKYVRGFFEQEEVPLYVNRGLGTTNIDLRIGAVPEVSILTLVGKKT